MKNQIQRRKIKGSEFNVNYIIQFKSTHMLILKPLILFLVIAYSQAIEFRRIFINLVQ